MNKHDEDRHRRLAQLAAEASEPDTSDIPEAAPGSWHSAEVGRFRDRNREAVTLKLDSDVLEWFRRSSGDSDYQAAINDVLRDHVAAHALK